MIKYVGFDKDGTLINDQEGYTREWGKLVKENFNIDQKEAEDLFRNMAGDPAVLELDAILKKHNISLPYAELFSKAEDFSYHIGENFKGNVFPDVLAVFKKLKEAGYKIFVSSGQEQIITKEDLERTGLMEYVDYYVGLRPDQPEFKKGEPHFREVAKHFGVDFKLFCKQAVSVGDTQADIDNPKKLGMKSISRIGTLSKDKLLELGAKIVIEDLSTLPEILKTL
jgi:phosphoglycolate phosphatase-like HAD superfamily hydrolase